jgi:hypothetical protein
MARSTAHRPESRRNRRIAGRRDLRDALAEGTNQAGVGLQLTWRAARADGPFVCIGAARRLVP